MDKVVTRPLAHLLAAQIQPHPKQAKEPTSPPSTEANY
jgi:hypothetical protein